MAVEVTPRAIPPGPVAVGDRDPLDGRYRVTAERVAEIVASAHETVAAVTFRRGGAAA